MAHHTLIRVRFHELDPYGHVNHAVYATYFELGRADALEACGVTLEDLAGSGVQLVGTRLDLRYRSPAVAGDRLTVETAVGEMRRASGTWLQRIVRGETVVAVAEVTAAVTGLDGRPMRPPDWLFPALEKLQVVEVPDRGEASDGREGLPEGPP